VAPQKIPGCLIYGKKGNHWGTRDWGDWELIHVRGGREGGKNAHLVVRKGAFGNSPIWKKGGRGKSEDRGSHSGEKIPFGGKSGEGVVCTETKRRGHLQGLF